MKDSQESLSPSDFLCQKSIDDSKPSTTVKKRHVLDKENGEGNNVQVIKSILKDPSTNTHTQYKLKRGMYSNQSPTTYEYYGDISEIDYKNDHDDILDQDEILLDFDLSDQYGSTCYASAYSFPERRVNITSYDTPITYQIHKLVEV